MSSSKKKIEACLNQMKKHISYAENALMDDDFNFTSLNLTDISNLSIYGQKLIKNFLSKKVGLKKRIQNLIKKEGRDKWPVKNN